MIETQTTWDDTGYDCDHCGGRILRRTDRETGQPDRKCFQCEGCSCQWTLSHRPLRVGKQAACRAAQRERDGEAAPNSQSLRWLLVVLVVLGGFFLLRFGGGVVLRAALPTVILAIGAYVLFKMGRQAGWW